MAAKTTLVDEVLDLPAEERADLVGKLLDSLEATLDPTLSPAWEQEIRVRVDRVLDGKAKGAPWTDVRERVLLKLRDRTRP
jgi:putative addiction module component (TIGR02574 family)